MGREQDPDRGMRSFRPTRRGVLRVGALAGPIAIVIVAGLIVPREQRFAAAVGAIIFGVAVGFLIWLPKWQVARLNGPEKERLQLENAARQTLAQILGGLFVLVTLVFTWQTVQSTRRSVEIAEQGQITDRFAQATRQLGDSALAIRLGGIYALERIARDSQRDHWPVMEILTAFVRERAPWTEEVKRERVPLDIQAVVTVIGRRTLTHESFQQRLDLQETDLRLVDLSGSRFGRALLRGARLMDAQLRVVDLGGADLEFADLSGALFGESLSKFYAHSRRWDNLVMKPRGANLQGANLSGARLNRANLTWTNFSAADLSQAVLIEANLYHANFRGANLRGAILRRADLTGADLTGADVGGTDFTAAIMPDGSVGK